MIKKFLFFLFLACSFIAQAQYTELINSNRPGFSESPYSVGPNVYQFEGNFFFRDADAIPTFSNPGAYGLNFAFRTSFFLPKLELNLNTSIQNDRIAFKNIYESSYREFGFSQLTFGAKYLVFEPTYTDKSKEVRSWKKRHAFDWKRLYPSVAVYAGANFGNTLSAIHERGGITPKVGVLLQNEFSNKFNLITNIYYDYIGSDFSQWSYVITGTYNLTPRWSGFVEHQALFDNIQSQSNLGAGVAYLFTPNFQINGSLRATFQDNSTGYYSSVGVSYRIDRHQDKYKEYDENGNLVTGETPEYEAKKGFFGRMFGWLNFFKKKDDREQKVDLDIEGDDEKDGEKTRKKPKRKRKKSTTKKKGFFGKIFGDDPEAQIKKSEKKAKRKAEKEKRKEEKRKAKEARKLEKEIEKLEKELKEEEEREKKQKEKNKKKDN